MAYLEEESNDKYLQTAHADDEKRLNHAKVDDAVLGAHDGRKVAVLTRAEVLLVSRNGRQLARDLVDRLLEDIGLLGARALLRGELSASLVLNLRVNCQSRVDAVLYSPSQAVVALTEISMSTNFSAKVLIWLLKQNA